GAGDGWIHRRSAVLYRFRPGLVFFDARRTPAGTLEDRSALTSGIPTQRRNRECSSVLHSLRCETRRWNVPGARKAREDLVIHTLAVPTAFLGRDFLFTTVVTVFSLPVATS